jgi:hypothetical protein
MRAARLAALEKAQAAKLAGAPGHLLAVVGRRRSRVRLPAGELAAAGEAAAGRGPGARDVRALLGEVPRLAALAAPCLVMTAGSAGVHLPRDGRRFDLVIIDDAERLTADEAAGPMSLGGACAVAGEFAGPPQDPSGKGARRKGSALDACLALGYPRIDLAPPCGPVPGAAGPGAAGADPALVGTTGGQAGGGFAGDGPAAGGPAADGPAGAMAVEGPVSRFAGFVADALERRGWTVLRGEAGGAPAGADLAVADPGDPSGRLACVDCYGSGYRDAPTVMEREVGRTGALARAGERVLQAWCMDWLGHPSGPDLSGEMVDGLDRELKAVLDGRRRAEGGAGLSVEGACAPEAGRGGRFWRDGYPGKSLVIQVF